MLSSRIYLILDHDRPFLFYMNVYHFHDKLRTQWLYVWVNLSKNVIPLLQKLQGSFVLNFPFISIFDFKAINYCTESKNVKHIFFYISLYRTPVQCVSEYKIPFTLYSYDDLYSLQKWPRSSKPFSWKWNKSFCYVPRRDTNVR